MLSSFHNCSGISFHALAPENLIDFDLYDKLLKGYLLLLCESQTLTLEKNPK